MEPEVAQPIAAALPLCRTVPGPVAPSRDNTGLAAAGPGTAGAGRG